MIFWVARRYLKNYYYPFTIFEAHSSAPIAKFGSPLKQVAPLHANIGEYKYKAVCYVSSKDIILGLI